ncbi:hypothetical protein [Roseateles sp. P5_D6]
MRWSALKAATESLLAPAVAGRVQVHVTRHHKPSSRGSAWFVVDGIEIARACDWVYTRTRYWKPELVGTTDGSSGALPWGTESAWDVKLACWELVHGGAVAALESPNAALRALALLHRKVGRAQVLKAVASARSPLEEAFASFRAEAEGWLPAAVKSTANPANHSLQRTATPPAEL